jgi:ATP-dependent RNA helicase DDX18/HAS1
MLLEGLAYMVVALAAQGESRALVPRLSAHLFPVVALRTTEQDRNPPHTIAMPPSNKSATPAKAAKTAAAATPAPAKKQAAQQPSRKSAPPATAQQPQSQKKKQLPPPQQEEEEEEEEEDEEEDDAEMADEQEGDEEEEEEEQGEDEEEAEAEEDEEEEEEEAAPAPAPVKAVKKQSPALAAQPAPAAAAVAGKKRKGDAAAVEEEEPSAKKPHSAAAAASQSAAAAAAPAATGATAAGSSLTLANAPTFEFGEESAAFTSLPLSGPTLKAIAAMGFARMTPVQARCIPVALKGEDILGAAKTGSGKTLAFLIPAVELLVRSGFKARNGTGALVISPTRELALQIFQVMSELCKFHSFTHGLVMGGTDMRRESQKLLTGVNLLVGTPGRIVDHLEHCEGWNYANLVCLIIDEADRILEMGFEDQLRAIIKRLPNTQRQTLLFSATQTKNVKDIAVLSMKGRPVYIGVDDGQETSTAEGVEQGYVVCPSEQRFLLLFTFLKRNLNKKVIVFFSTCAATTFYTELLNYIDIPCVELHGKQKQAKRTSTFFEFRNADKGILLATDVAARGLDIPQVDWIIQFDPPEEPKEYIHRVGRTARGAGRKGRALLFLLPQELGFLRFLKQARIPLNEYEFPSNKISKVQAQLEHLVQENYYLHKSAREAYRSYMQGYAQHTLKSCFNVQALDVRAVARSFGFDAPPKVHLKISLKSLKQTDARAGKQQAAAAADGSKHGFSEDNPYGRAPHKAQQQQSKQSVQEDDDNDARARNAQQAVTKKTQARQWSR